MTPIAPANEALSLTLRSTHFKKHQAAITDWRVPPCFNLFLEQVFLCLLFNLPLLLMHSSLPGTLRSTRLTLLRAEFLLQPFPWPNLFISSIFLSSFCLPLPFLCTCPCQPLLGAPGCNCWGKSFPPCFLLFLEQVYFSAVFMSLFLQFSYLPSALHSPHHCLALPSTPGFL